jgi:hypothetical protein
VFNGLGCRARSPAARTDDGVNDCRVIGADLHVVTNARSIFGLLTGRLERRRSVELPVPKSCMLSSKPSRRSSPSVAAPPSTSPSGFSRSTPVSSDPAAAAYGSCFTANGNGLAANPILQGACSVNNGDHAGTAESATYRSCIAGGARGGGGSNFTGPWSGTVGVAPACHSPRPGQLRLEAREISLPTVCCRKFGQHGSGSAEPHRTGRRPWPCRPPPRYGGSTVEHAAAVRMTAPFHVTSRQPAKPSVDLDNRSASRTF